MSSALPPPTKVRPVIIRSPPPMPMKPPPCPQPLRQHHLHGTIDVWLGAAGHSFSLTPLGFSRCAGVQDRTEGKAGHQESQPAAEMPGPAGQAIHDRQQQENGSRAPTRPRRVPSPLSLPLSTRVPTRRDLLLFPLLAETTRSQPDRWKPGTVPHYFHPFHTRTTITTADHPPTPALSMLLGGWVERETASHQKHTRQARDEMSGAEASVRRWRFLRGLCLTARSSFALSPPWAFLGFRRHLPASPPSLPMGQRRERARPPLRGRREKPKLPPPLPLLPPSFISVPFLPPSVPSPSSPSPLPFLGGCLS
jgi:hypothetical protein